MRMNADRRATVVRIHGCFDLFEVLSLMAVYDEIYNLWLATIEER